MTRSTKNATEAYSESLYKNLEQLLLNGRHKSVLSELRKLSHNRLSRKQTYQVASLARRAGDPKLTLRLLNPIVRPTQGRDIVANDAECAVYAAALVRIGAVEEGLEILSRLKGKEPQIYFFRAHAHIAQWDYAESIDELEQYVAFPQLTEYERILGNLNLAAAKVHEREFNEVGPLISELKTSARRLGLKSILGNTLEISAQMAIDQGRWEEAEENLAEAATELTEAVLDSFFVEKWRAILNFKKNPNSNNALSALHHVREKAAVLNNWETLRDCDLTEALLLGNEEKLIHLYYGTPFEAFRRRIFMDFKKPIEIPSTFSWKVGPARSQSPTWSPFEIDDKVILRGILKRAMEILVSDFYRPVRVGQLYNQLYPGEYFRPDSSPGRVHQTIHSLRGWLAASKIPLTVTAFGVGYGLTSSRGCWLTVPHRRTRDLPETGYLASLKTKWPRSEFSATEAALFLKISRSTALRELRQAVSENKIMSQGQGSARRYFFR